MFFTRFSTSSLLASVLLLGFANSASDGVCRAFGVDFQDGNKYFINTNSLEQFTCVTEFEGCVGEDAFVTLVDPNGDSYYCDNIHTTPDDTPFLSSCPLAKSAMIGGTYIIITQGNNGDEGDPFAWMRTFELDCGPQITTTVTPVITWNVTTTPYTTVSTTSTITSSETKPNTKTVTLPSQTARYTITVTPKPVTKWFTYTYTRTRKTWKQFVTTVRSTVTAGCTIPPKQGHPDPKCTLNFPGLPLPLPTGRKMRFEPRLDRPMDPKLAREYLNKARRNAGLPELPAIPEKKKRAPDAPTLTVTALTPVNTTVYYEAPTVYISSTIYATTTTTTTLPPVTIYRGVLTRTTTAPTPTKTRYTYTVTTTTVTKTLNYTWTYRTTVIPTSSVSACRRRGGHMGMIRV